MSYLSWLALYHLSCSTYFMQHLLMCSRASHHTCSRASCAWYLKCYRASQFPYLKYYCVSRAACFTCFVSYLPACSLYPTCFRCFITNIISSISCLLSLSFLVPLLVFVFSCFFFFFFQPGLRVITMICNFY